MYWTAQNDDAAFVKEMLLFEPWQYMKGSLERGNVWKALSSFETHILRSTIDPLDSHPLSRPPKS